MCAFERGIPMRHGALRLAVSIFIAVVFWGVLSGYMTTAPLWALDHSTTGRVVVVPIHGTIELGLSSFLKRIIKEAEKNGSQAVLLEMDTPGGRVDAAVMSKHYLFESTLPTYAFISREAISAGAMIALATEKIYMAPSASIGDIEPIPRNEKILTYVRAQLREIAQKRGRDTTLLESMVDRDLDVAHAPAGTLLTLTSQEACDLGVAEGQYTDMTSLLDALFGSGVEVVTPAPNWAEKLVRFLTNPTVCALLFTLGFYGLIAEITSPGIGFMGAGGLICLSLYFWAQYLTGLAGLEVFVLLILGVVLLAVEVFIIPGFGLAGITGSVALAGGVLWSFAKLCQYDYTVMLWHIVGSTAVLGLLIFFTFKYLPRSRFWKGIALEEELSTETGYVAVPEELAQLEGASGVALTDLRPSGMARIDGRRVDVVTEGDYFNRGDAVVVFQVAGGRIVVRKQRK